MCCFDLFVPFIWRFLHFFKEFPLSILIYVLSTIDNLVLLSLLN